MMLCREEIRSSMDLDTASLKRGPSCLTAPEDSAGWEVAKKAMLQAQAYAAPPVPQEVAQSEHSMLVHKTKLCNWYDRVSIFR